MVASGKLDQLIGLEREAATPDGIGGTVLSWGPVPVDPIVWARVFTKRSTEAQINDRLVATALVIFTIYNRTDLTELDRIIWNAVAYNIRAVQRASGRDLFLIIEAERGVTQ